MSNFKLILNNAYSYSVAVQIFFFYTICMKVNTALHVSEHVLYFLKHTIREMNKKLYDSNDGLRSALASEAVASKRRVSPMFADDIFPHTHWLYIR